VISQSQRAAGLRVTTGAALFPRPSVGACLRIQRGSGADPSLVCSLLRVASECLVESPVLARESKQQPLDPFEPPRRGFRALAQPHRTSSHRKQSSFNTPSYSLHPSFYHGLLKNGLLLINGSEFRALPCKSLRVVSSGRPGTHDTDGIDNAMRYQPEQRRAHIRFHLTPLSVHRASQTNRTWAQDGFR
jgi:hypothetical protein